MPRAGLKLYIFSIFYVGKAPTGAVDDITRRNVKTCQRSMYSAWPGALIRMDLIRHVKMGTAESAHRSAGQQLTPLFPGDYRVQHLANRLIRAEDHLGKLFGAPHPR